MAWGVFGAIVMGMLAIDLGIFHRKSRQDSIREAALWCCVWVAVALLFNLGVYFAFGAGKAMEFLTAYLVEESLSVDNIFVFVAIFTYFAVDKTHQHRVLFWGIIGAQVMRGIFIFAGLAVINRFQWVTYLLGAFLVLTGFRFAKEETEVNPEKNPVIRFFRELVPVTATFRGQSFFVREQGKWMATPLFVVLLVVELTDVIFATDSVPAVLAIARDPFIVYSSNIFAILGLRALYFVLRGAIVKFHYLRYGLAAILIFVGAKMLAQHFYQVPISASLGVIGTLLAFSIFLSVMKDRRHAKHHP